MAKKVNYFDASLIKECLLDFRSFAFNKTQYLVKAIQDSYYVSIHNLVNFCGHMYEYERIFQIARWCDHVLKLIKDKSSRIYLMINRIFSACLQHLEVYQLELFPPEQFIIDIPLKRYFCLDCIYNWIDKAIARYSDWYEKFMLSLGKAPTYVQLSFSF